MKMTYYLLIAIILFGNGSCTEQKERHEKTETELILDKIQSGTAKDSDMEELIESMAGDRGSHQVIFPKAKFKITFPVINVKEKTTTQIIENEEVEVYQYSANMQDKNDFNLAYNLSYVFLPEIKSKDDIKDLFNGQRDYILSATNSKLEFEKVITINDIPGRHLYMTIDKSKLKSNYKMYFKNGIFYTLAVVTEEGKLFNKSASRFFNSFEITE